MKIRPREDVMVMTTPEVRRQLKIIAAMTGSTMKDVLERLVGEEFRRVTPDALGGRRGSPGHANDE
jgi:hypothetical protein